MNVQRAKMPGGVAAVLVTLLLMALGAPTAAAAEGKPQYAPVKVEAKFKDEDQEPDRAKRVIPVLRQSVVDALKSRHGIDVTDSAETTLSFIVISLEEDQKVRRKLIVMNYGVLIEVVREGTKAGDKVVYCTDKGEAQLVACAVDGIESVLPLLPVRPAPEPSPTGPAGGPLSPEPGSERGPEPESARVAPIGGVGSAGIVMGAVGLGVAIAGGVDLGRGEVREETTRTALDTVTDHRPRGRALLGSGIGVLVVGAVMVGVDVGIRAKKRKSQQGMGFHFNVRPGFAGATLHGRF